MQREFMEQTNVKRDYALPLQRNWLADINFLSLHQIRLWIQRHSLSLYFHIFLFLFILSLIYSSIPPKHYMNIFYLPSTHWSHWNLTLLADLANSNSPVSLNDQLVPFQIPQRRCLSDDHTFTGSECCVGPSLWRYCLFEKASHINDLASVLSYSTQFYYHIESR